MLLRQFLVILFFIGVQNFSCAVNAEEMYLESVIAKYSNYLENMTPIQFAGKTQMVMNKTKIVDDYMSVLKYDRQKLYLQRNSIVDQDKYNELVIDRFYNHYYEMTYNSDRELRIAGCVDKTKIPSPESRLGMFGIPLGWLMLDEIIFIPNLFDKTTNTVNMITDGHTDIYCIRGVYRDYNFVAHFNPKHSFALQYLQLKRRGLSNKPYQLNDITFLVESHDDNVEFFFPQKYNVISTISGGTMVMGSETNEIEGYVTQYDITVTDLEKKTLSDGDFALTQKLPNGTPVQMLDAPQIQYVWLDGKIVAKTDEVALRIARGDHGFMPGPKNPRLWFMILGAVLLLVGGGLKIRAILRPV